VPADYSVLHSCPFDENILSSYPPFCRCDVHAGLKCPAYRGDEQSLLAAFVGLHP